MKLYTEEQVRKAWNTAFTDALRIDEEDYTPTFYGEFINELTFIELPSEEEIFESAKTKQCSFHAFIYGAEWAIKQIKNQTIGH